MSARMGAVLSYRHEDGINWSSPGLLRGERGGEEGENKTTKKSSKKEKRRSHGTVLVGSCPQTPEDVSRLSREAGVTHILQLQQGADLDHFGIDGEGIRRAAAREGVTHLRVPIVDFDPFSLRDRLPDAVAVLDSALRYRTGEGMEPVVYVHCTAGLGRAPAVALAHASWCRDFDGEEYENESGEESSNSSSPSLEQLYSDLASVRPCAPKLDAIKEAAADLVLGGGGDDAAVAVTLGFRRGALEYSPPGSSNSAPVVIARIAGLDGGWGARFEPTIDKKTGRATLTRRLRPGKHFWKLCWTWKDAKTGEERSFWATSPHHPSLIDAGGSKNNVIEVPREKVPTVEGMAAERRLASSSSSSSTNSNSNSSWRLTPNDKRILRAALAAREARAMEEAEDPLEAGVLMWLVRAARGWLASSALRKS
jgi:protein-tyrosine phosphatase